MLHFRSVVLFLVLLAMPVVTSAQGLVQSYKASGELKPGWLVTLDSSSPGSVKAAPASSAGEIYGVVVNPDEASVVVKNSSGEVYVATTGDFSVLVSTERGALRTGDYISMSGREGVAAKATNAESFVIGRMLEDFDGNSQNLLKDDGGIALDLVKVQVQPGENPLAKNAVVVPGPLKNFVESVSGQALSPLRIYSALIVFIICIAVATLILITGARSGMVAIGRNPLSKPLIFQGLARVLALSLVVFIAGLVGIYLLLKL